MPVPQAKTRCYLWGIILEQKKSEKKKRNQNKTGKKKKKKKEKMTHFTNINQKTSAGIWQNISGSIPGKQRSKLSKCSLSANCPARRMWYQQEICVFSSERAGKAFPPSRAPQAVLGRYAVAVKTVSSSPVCQHDLQRPCHPSVVLSGFHSVSVYILPWKCSLGCNNCPRGNMRMVKALWACNGSQIFPALSSPGQMGLCCGERESLH